MNVIIETDTQKTITNNFMILSSYFKNISGNLLNMADTMLLNLTQIIPKYLSKCSGLVTMNIERICSS